MKCRRPLIPVVEDVALAMCDVRTTNPENNIEVMNVLPEYTRHNFYLKFSDKLRFYYLSNMTDQEVCAFVVFDSENTYSKCESLPVKEKQILTSTPCIEQCPHTAFRLGKYMAGEKPSRPRESIELRILALL